MCHATINVDELDPECELDGLVINQPREVGSIAIPAEQLVRHAGHQLGRDRQEILISARRHPLPGHPFRRSLGDN